MNLKPFLNKPHQVQPPREEIDHCRKNGDFFQSNPSIGSDLTKKQQSLDRNYKEKRKL
ncbi:MAG: hypothetical protein KGS60_15460 [Verrucomicrobia bacterium]|nr:hypothetical protein [Verrucomicrobiota bacterium]